MRAVVRDSEAACQAAGLVAKLGEENGDGLTLADSLQAQIRSEVAARHPLTPPNEIEAAIDDALTFNESDLVQATGTACSIPSIGL